MTLKGNLKEDFQFTISICVKTKKVPTGDKASAINIMAIRHNHD